MRIANLKLIGTSLALSAAALLSSSNLSAQATSPYIMIAGSSAMFNDMAAVAFEQNAGGYNLCGPHHWTYKSSGANTVAIHDARSSSIVDEPGTIWVSWNDAEISGAANPKVCAYISVDSTVGVRAAFAVLSDGTAAASIAIASALQGVAGQNKIPNTTIADEALPAVVYTTLNNAKIDTAAADIRPEDAKFATSRTLTAQGTHMTNTLLTHVYGLGYANPSTPSIGYPIKSSQGTSTANPVDFALFGNDPISGGAAYSGFKAYNVGAGPVMVFVNTQNSATGHFGDASLTNVSSSVLAGFVSGTLTRTRDAFNTSGLGEFPVKAFVREPLSGTMNVFEYSVANSFRFLTSQEKGAVNVSTGGSDNPFAQAGTLSGSGRYRTIGTGEQVATVIKAANTDSIGYAFWGFGNFAGTAVSGAASGNIARYLTVDGVDPLYSSAAANPNGTGVFPVKTGSTYPVLSFPNVANGSYPIWTIFRLVANPNANSSVVALFASIAQGDTARYSDYIAAPSLQVFHTHFFNSSINGSNGHIAYDAVNGIYYPEQGGDMGGQVFPNQADFDYITDTNKEIINIHN